MLTAHCPCEAGRPHKQNKNTRKGASQFFRVGKMPLCSKWDFKGLKKCASAGSRITGTIVAVVGNIGLWGIISDKISANSSSFLHRNLACHQKLFRPSPRWEKNQPRVDRMDKPRQVIEINDKFKIVASHLPLHLQALHCPSCHSRHFASHRQKSLRPNLRPKEKKPRPV